MVVVDQVEIMQVQKKELQELLTQVVVGVEMVIIHRSLQVVVEVE
jgi:hypothetical protein